MAPRIVELSKARVVTRARMGITLASLIACFGVGELVLRIVNPEVLALATIVEPSEFGGSYALRPGARVAFHGLRDRFEPAVRWVINAQGLRAERPILGRSDRYRVALHGDSEVFGWPLELEDTMGKRMESLDPRLEVLNFGVPGYNANDVANRIEKTTPDYAPDLLVYLLNANDYDPAMSVSRWMRYSSVYLHTRVMIEAIATRLRESDAGRVDYLVGEIERIVQNAERIDVPLVVYFIRQKELTNLLGHPAGARRLAALEDQGDRSKFAAALAEARFGLSLLVAPARIHDLPSVDYHLGAPAHQMLAERLCSAIAGAGEGCTP